MQMTRLAKGVLLTTTVLVMSSTPVFAQDQSETPEAGSSGLDMIVVTAQKREQDLQAVPLSISAISSEKLEQLQVADSRDLSGIAPNVVVTQGTTSLSAAVISIRGITSPASETFGLDTANGLYVDGIYIARSGATGLDVTDIERVEILRGPQGTLFGRNTTGGAISFISRKPSEEFGVKGEAGYGNYNSWNGKVSLDTGELFGGLKSTFSYSHREKDGYIDNLLEPDSSRDPGARKSDAFRAALRLDVGGTGYFQYIFDWTKTTGNPPPFQLTNVADGTPRPPITIDGNQVVQTQQTSVAQYLANATFLEPDCAAVGTPTRAYRDTLCLNSDELGSDKIVGHNFQAGNDFGDFAVKMTAGYRQWDSITGGSDLDGLGTIRGPLFSSATVFNGFAGTSAASLLPFVFPAGTPQSTINFVAGLPVPTTTADLFTTNNVREHEQFSTEVEISGDTDSFDWVVGGFYFSENGSEVNPQRSGFVLDTNAAVFSRFGPLSGAFQAANPARYRLVVTPAILAYRASGDSTAIYGQTTVYPGGRDSGLSLTAGGRYTWDNKQISRTQNGAAPLAQIERGKASFSKFTWNVMGRYEFTPDISAFARVATGYRSGGFNAGDPVASGTTIAPFNEESVTSYEIGIKSELLDSRLRLNVAAYRNIYDDLAIFVPVFNGDSGTFQTRITNAGKVEYTGVEADFQAILSDNFSIDGAAGYVDTKFKQFLAGQPVVPTDPVVNIGSVSRAGYSSPLTANLAFNAKFPIGSGDSELRFRVGYTHEDGKYSFNNSIASPFNEEIKGDDRDLVDAQIVIDKVALGSGKARFMLWGKNLTNSHDLVRGIDFGPLGYAGGYFAEPRTYGATLGFEF